MLKIVLSLLIAATIVKSAGALELVKYDRPCLDHGDPGNPLRQTIVILDEGLVGRGPNADKDNLRWKRVLLEIADAIQAQPSSNLMPHERLSLYLWRADGSELTPVFLGCSPNISEQQRLSEEKGTSFISWALTGGPSKTIENSKEGFRNAMADAIAQIDRLKPNRPGSPAAMVQALSNASRLVDLNDGLPRIVFISPFLITGETKWRSTAEAMNAGFDLGTQAQLDLRRAEVYAVVLRSPSNDYLRSFISAFLLKSRGLLADWRTDGAPQFLPPPRVAKVFGGAVQIGDVQAPVQIRIAFDEQGTLVNSWIEVTTGRSLATPISGKAICKSADSCEVKGDGNLMGQAWNPDPRDEPSFDPQFGWSGLRYFELDYSGQSGRVRIWDPKVGKIQMGDRQLEDFRFPVVITDNQRF